MVNGSSKNKPNVLSIFYVLCIMYWCIDQCLEDLLNVPIKSVH